MSSVDELWRDYCARNGPIARGMSCIEEPDGTRTWVLGTLLEHDVLRDCVKRAKHVPIVTSSALDLDRTQLRIRTLFPAEFYDNRRADVVQTIVAQMAKDAARRDVTKVAIDRIRVERAEDPIQHLSTVLVQVFARQNHTPQWMNALLVDLLAEQCDDAVSGITIRRFSKVDTTVAPDELAAVETAGSEWTRDETRMLGHAVAIELSRPRSLLRGYAIISVTRVPRRDRPTECEKIVARLALYHVKPPP